MIVKLDTLGSSGILSDPHPTHLPPNAINSLVNGWCETGSVHFVGGEIKLFNLGCKPLYHTLYTPPGSTEQQFIVSDGVRVLAYNPSGVEQTLKADLDGGAVTFTTLNGILVFNSETDGPFFVNITGASIDPLPGWNATWRCRQIIAFKYYLVALGFKEGVQELPYLIRWSTSADPGAIPTSWTPAADNDAGDLLLADTPGPIVTSIGVANALWVVKTDSIYALQWVGGTFIFQSSKLTEMIGSRIPLGVCEFQSGLALLTSNDVFYFDGQNLKSLARSQIRDRLFEAIAPQWRYAQLFASSRRGMLMVGAPSSSSGTLLNELYLFNLQEGIWSHKDFYYGYGMDEGFVQAHVGAVKTWDASAGSWEEQPGIWNQNAYDPEEKQIILYRTNAQDTAWWVEVWSRSFPANQAGLAIHAQIARHGIPLVESNQVVMIRKIWVEVTGDVSEVEFYVGIQKAEESPLIKQGPWKVIPNQTNQFAPRLTGRFFYWEMKVRQPGSWRLASLMVDFMPAGER